MASGEVRWNEVSVAEFTREASRKAVRIVTGRIAAEARDTFPVLDLFRTRPPGEGWSLPPGHARSTVDTREGTDISGTEYGEVTADPVYRFRQAGPGRTGKRRHGLRPSIDEALDHQYGRAVP